MNSATPSCAALVLSRDRPLQLDATLSSLARHCRDPQSLDVTVLFRATNRRQRAAYSVVAHEHGPTARLVAESEFAEDVRTWLAGATSELVLFCVDDTIFVRPFHIADAGAVLGREPSVVGVSLRLGCNTTYCQPAGRRVGVPEFVRLGGSEGDEILGEGWGQADGDFGYPFDLSSSIYRYADVAAAISGTQFSGPNSLEHSLWVDRARFASTRPALALYARARAVSLPLNRVQAVAPNPTSGLARHTPRALLGAYSRGWRVDVAAYEGFSPPTCHVEAELLLRRADRGDGVA